MPRNLDHRVEIVAPVEDSRAQAELTRVFDTLLADNAQAWELHGRRDVDAARSPRRASERGRRRRR